MSSRCHHPMLCNVSCHIISVMTHCHHINGKCVGRTGPPVSGSTRPAHGPLKEALPPPLAFAATRGGATRPARRWRRRSPSSRGPSTASCSAAAWPPSTPCCGRCGPGTPRAASRPGQKGGQCPAAHPDVALRQPQRRAAACPAFERYLLGSLGRCCPRRAMA